MDYSKEQLHAADDILKKLQSNQKDSAIGNTSVVARQIMLKFQSKGLSADVVTKKVTKIQALVRGRRARKQYQKRKRAQAFRDNVANIHSSNNSCQ